MSTTTSISDSDFSASGAGSELERRLLERAVIDVFRPFPLYGEYSTSMDDYWLIRPVCAVARAYSEIVDDTLKLQWRSITKMLDNLEASIQPGRPVTEDHVISQLCEMQTGGTLLIPLQTFC